MKMRKLTLNMAWELCLEEWRDGIIAKLDAGDARSVDALKAEWCKEKGYDICEDCFFCEYAKQQIGNCPSCPARKIDKDFSCHNAEYAYDTEPHKFYKKIKSLNKIRLQGKKK